MLACEANCQCWHLPEIEDLAPAGDNPTGEFLGQHNVGIERQVRTVLLKRAYRHAKDRTCAQAPGDLEKCQVADCSARHRTFHVATIHQLRTLGGAFYHDSSVAVCCQCRGTSPRL